MKKRILSILLLCCMVLTMMPATVFAADGEVAARASETGGLYEHHEACGADPAGASDTMMPKTRSGAVRPAATQFTIRCITMPTAAAARRQVRARPARIYLYGFPYQKKFQPVTDIPSRVGRIVRMENQSIFAKRDIIGIT